MRMKTRSLKSTILISISKSMQVSGEIPSMQSKLMSFVCDVGPADIIFAPVYSQYAQKISETLN